MPTKSPPQKQPEDTRPAGGASEQSQPKPAKPPLLASRAAKLAVIAASLSAVAGLVAARLLATSDTIGDRLLSGDNGLGLLGLVVAASTGLIFAQLMSGPPMTAVKAGRARISTWIFIGFALLVGLPLVISFGLNLATSDTWNLNWTWLLDTGSVEGLSLIGLFVLAIFGWAIISAMTSASRKKPARPQASPDKSSSGLTIVQLVLLVASFIFGSLPGLLLFLIAVAPILRFQSAPKFM